MVSASLVKENCVHVAAAVIRRGSQILLSKRKKHVHQGDLWEFPGGKVETGESLEQSLVRELQEELGITPTRYEPLIQILHDYGDKSVFLDVWTVHDFSGNPEGKEGQLVEWVEESQLHLRAFPAANNPIVKAAQLPDRYAITPDVSFDNRESFLRDIESAIQSQHLELIQFRAPSLDVSDFVAIARELVPLSRRLGCCCLLNHAPDVLQQVDADGLHLNSQRLRALSSSERAALSEDYLLAASCHSEEELLLAMDKKIDFATLSPVLKTASHPDADPMGWNRLSKAVLNAKLPVFALGGLSTKDLGEAKYSGAQGIASIRAFFPSVD